MCRTAALWNNKNMLPHFVSRRYKSDVGYHKVWELVITKLNSCFITHCVRFSKVRLLLRAAAEKEVLLQSAAAI